MNHESILIVDFGGPNSQLIARKIRDLNVYCEITPHFKSLEVINKLQPKGIIFTGENTPVAQEIIQSGISILTEAEYT
ncbi:MAG: GMP synthase (glutamine-hydrolyzing), partial [Peptostreptococcales bacterium]